MGQRLDNARALYLEAIRDGDARGAITRYAGSRYTQHSHPVRDGHEGFVEFFEGFTRRYPVRDVEILRGWEDGRYVVLHALQTLGGGERRYVTADIFDTDDEARLVEHWDVIAEVVDDPGSGRSPIDGPTEVSDLDRTEENRAVVAGFIRDVLTNGETHELSRYVPSGTWVQHGRLGAAGLAEHGTPRSYRETHLVVGSGNFVAALSEVRLAVDDGAVIDIFRVEDGLLVEHWDVVEVIRPREEWVNGGKF